MHRSALVVPLLVLLFTLNGCSAVEKLASSIGGGSCSGPSTLASSGTASGSTSSAACAFPDGSKGALYTLAPSQPTNVELTVTPNGFTPFLGVWTSTGTSLGQINTSPWRLRLFLAPGSYQVGVSSVSKDGSYTLASAPAEVTNCKAGPGGALVGDDMGIAMRGVVISGALTNADCGGNAMRADGYLLPTATTGSSWTITVTADRAANIEVWSESQNVALKSLNAAGSMTVTASAPSPNGFRLFVSGTPGSGAINYTLSIN